MKASVPDEAMVSSILGKPAYPQNYDCLEAVVGKFSDVCFQLGQVRHVGLVCADLLALCQTVGFCADLWALCQTVGFCADLLALCQTVGFCADLLVLWEGSDCSHSADSGVPPTIYVLPRPILPRESEI